MVRITLQAMAYIDQFDNMVRARDGGKLRENIRTIVVFSDGIVVCASGIHGGVPIPTRGLLGGILRAAQPVMQDAVRGHRDEEIRKSAQAMGEAATAEAFARTRNKAIAIPFIGIRRIVLAEPSDGRKLVIYQETGNPDRAVRSAYRCDLSAARVREVLGPLLGNRLKIQVPD
jgi:hypothetical protein